MKLIKLTPKFVINPDYVIRVEPTEPPGKTWIYISSFDALYSTPYLLNLPMEDVIKKLNEEE